MVECNENIGNAPPSTFYEAVQFMAWYNIISRMCGGEGAAMGAPDQWLYPYYRRDIDSGVLTGDKALFHISCLLYKDNFYAQIGGCDAEGNDLCNELTDIVLDAMHLVRIPTSICLRVHKNLNRDALEKGIDYMFQDKNGAPSFLGEEAMVQGLMRNGYPKELAISRMRSGCHWCNIPGREYTLNDCVKINLSKIFEVSLDEMIDNPDTENSRENLYLLFERHLRTAFSAVAAVALVQPHYGNTAPLQMEVDPMLEKDRGGLKLMSDFVNTFCTDMGGHSST